MLILNVTKATILADKVTFTETLWQRMIGLLGRKGLAEKEGLIIKHCSSIHTFFMRFPIDVIFLDRASRVRKVICGMQPFRLSKLVVGAKEVIELPSGVIATTNTEVADLIEIKP